MLSARVVRGAARCGRVRHWTTRSLSLRSPRVVKSNYINLLPLECSPGLLFRSPCSYSVSLYRSCSSRVWPAHHKVVLPALSPTMESGSIISWEKTEGDRVAEGDLLAEVETDKATMGFESSEEGYLAKILVEAGSKDIPLGKLLCIIVDSKDDVEKFADYEDTEGPAEVAAATTPQQSPPTSQTVTSSQEPPKTVTAPSQAPAVTSASPVAAHGAVMASPRARRAAADRGIDLATVATGSDGIVRFQHVVSTSSAQSAPALAAHLPPTTAHADIELTGMRKTIAKRLLQSKQTIPHYYLTMEVNMDAVLSARASINSTAGDGVRLSVNDFIIKAAALACMRVPEANSAWMDTFIRQYDSVDVCVAVSTEHGLITPIVFGAERRGLADISSTVKQLAVKARERRLQPHEFQGGTFSVSNLGMYGISQFSAIINPPQSCILAVGGTQQRPVTVSPHSAASAATQDSLSNVMAVTLSCDHRVVDGAVGAQWLSAFRNFLQQPLTMVL